MRSAGQAVISVTWECFVFPAADAAGFEVVKMAMMAMMVAAV